MQIKLTLEIEGLGKMEWGFNENTPEYLRNALLDSIPLKSTIAYMMDYKEKNDQRT